MRCERCGKETNIEDAYHIRMERYGRTESRDLCEDCKLLSEAFMTSAYIPGISKTQYDLLLYHARGATEQTPVEKIKAVVAELKENGATVPEIAKETNLCNKCVLKLVNQNN